MIEPCGRARVRFATGTSCSRSQGRPRRTGVPSLGEDPVPFIEIRRIDRRDCARERSLALSLSLSLATRPSGEDARRSAIACAVVIRAFLFREIAYGCGRSRCDSTRAPPEKILGQNGIIVIACPQDGQSTLHLSSNANADRQIERYSNEARAISRAESTKGEKQEYNSHRSPVPCL